MNKTIYSLEQIQNSITPIAESFGVDRVYLFGSYARGEATVLSDLDFRIDAGQIKSYFKLGALYNALSDIFDKPVDIVTTTGVSKDFLSGISNEEILLYGKQCKNRIHDKRYPNYFTYPRLLSANQNNFIGN